MGDLLERLENAKSEVSRLERQVAAATCAEVGHRWRSIGGANCGCEDGGCSVPVHECEVCGDSDYGENEWAAKVRAECASEAKP
jgi:hypothetical protein